jgi:hypothetical protein
MPERIKPFRDGDTQATFRNLLNKVQQEIDALDNQYVLKTSETELEEYFAGKVAIEPLRLNTEAMHIEGQRGIDVDVSRDFLRGIAPGERAHVRGTQLDLAIPYEGDPTLWRLRPSAYSVSGYPELYVHPDRVVLSHRFPDDTADQTRLKQEIASAVDSLKNALTNQARDVEQHNASASGSARAWVKSKRLKALATLNVIEGLGLPIKRRDVPAPLAVPVQRKKLELSRPAVSPEPFTPEPLLQDAVYEEILKALRAMSLVVERNPHSFQRLDEEGLRDHFLINLNNLFEGQATGETFNGVGKTDILIRVENRNVFIAECKVWGGPARFGEAIDQLLGYLTWRDCKCALLVFNRNKDSVAVQKKMHEVMSQRKEHRKTLSNKLDEGGRYVFVKDSEPGREIIIATLLFDVPVTQ